MKHKPALSALRDLASKYAPLWMQENSLILLAVFLIIFAQFFTILHSAPQRIQPVRVSHFDTCHTEALDIYKPAESLKSCNPPKFNEQIISHDDEITGDLFLCRDPATLQKIGDER